MSTREKHVIAKFIENTNWLFLGLTQRNCLLGALSTRTGTKQLMDISSNFEQKNKTELCSKYISRWKIVFESDQRKFKQLNKMVLGFTYNFKHRWQTHPNLSGYVAVQPGLIQFFLYQCLFCLSQFLSLDFSWQGRKGEGGVASSWRPFGPLDFVLRALRPCDPRVGNWIVC